VRYALTSEAGLNDGLAFPFVNLALALAIAADTGKPAAVLRHGPWRGLLSMRTI
jgi:NhaP-type Na+/H+ or K+/H+ antiporter